MTATEGAVRPARITDRPAYKRAVEIDDTLIAEQKAAQEGA